MINDRYRAYSPDNYQSETKAGRVGTFSEPNFDHVTCGIEILEQYYFPANSIVIGKAWRECASIDDVKIRELVKKVLLSINKAEKMILAMPNNDLTVKPIALFNTEDNSVYLEWMYEKCRIGFILEENEDDATWYIVFDPSLESRGFSGYLNEIEIGQFALVLTQFANSIS